MRTPEQITEAIAGLKANPDPADNDLHVTSAVAVIGVLQWVLGIDSDASQMIARKLASIGTTGAVCEQRSISLIRRSDGSTVFFASDPKGRTVQEVFADYNLAEDAARKFVGLPALSCVTLPGKLER